MRTDLYYKSGYKYQTSRLFVCRTGILPESDIHTEYISLLTDGTLIIQKGYAWDGPSGPTIDTPDTTAASLMHDAGYQLIREGYLEDCYRAHFDNLLKLTMKQDAAMYPEPIQSLAKLRADYFYEGVHIFGDKYAHEPKLEICIESCFNQKQFP